MQISDEEASLALRVRAENQERIDNAERRGRLSNLIRHRMACKGFSKRVLTALLNDGASFDGDWAQIVAAGVQILVRGESVTAGQVSAVASATFNDR